MPPAGVRACAAARLQDVTSADSAPRDSAERAAHRVEERVGDLARALKPRLRGVLHEAAFAVSLVTGTALVCLAEAGQPRTAAVIYAVSVALLFGTSAAYHRGSWSGRSHEVMKRLDHSMIFLAIAGTYTAVAGLSLPGSLSGLVLGLVWAGSVVGIASKLLWIGAPRWVVSGSYLAVGWVAVLALPQLWSSIGWGGFALLALGGALFSVGAVVYARRRPDPVPATFGYHEVFHALVIAAAVAHYALVAGILLPAA